MLNVSVVNLCWFIRLCNYKNDDILISQLPTIVCWPYFFVFLYVCWRELDSDQMYSGFQTICKRSLSFSCICFFTLIKILVNKKKSPCYTRNDSFQLLFSVIFLGCGIISLLFKTWYNILCFYLNRKKNNNWNVLLTYLFS